MNPRPVAALAIATLALSGLLGAQAPERCDLVIRNGRVMGGPATTGSPPTWRSATDAALASGGLRLAVAREILEYFATPERQGIGINFGTFYSQAQARRAVIGLDRLRESTM